MWSVHRTNEEECSCLQRGQHLFNFFLLCHQQLTRSCKHDIDPRSLCQKYVLPVHIADTKQYYLRFESYFWSPDNIHSPFMFVLVLICSWEKKICYSKCITGLLLILSAQMVRTGHPPMVTQSAAPSFTKCLRESHASSYDFTDMSWITPWWWIK